MSTAHVGSETVRGSSPPDEANFSAIDWLAVDPTGTRATSHSAPGASRGRGDGASSWDDGFDSPRHGDDESDDEAMELVNDSGGRRSPSRPSITPPPNSSWSSASRRGRGAGSHRQHHHDFVLVLIGMTSYCIEASQPWIAAIVVGVISGVVASCVEVVTQWLTDLKLGFCQHHMWATEHLCCVHDVSAWLHQCAGFVYWGEWFRFPIAAQFAVYVVVSTLLAVVASWLCITYAPYASGSGITEIKTLLSGIRIRHYLSLRVLIVKCVGLCASVGSGMALGKEGPFVHVGSCIGSVVGQWFPMYRHHEGASRELISASAAAGVAVAFGAPIGGVLFSLEEVSYFFPHRTMIQAFLTAIVSTLVLKKLDPTDTGRMVLFSVSYHHEFHWFELSAFALLGVLGGVVGAGINALNASWVHIKRHSTVHRHPVLEVCLLALVSSTLNFTLPLLRGGMLQTLADLFDDCSSTTSGDESFLCFQDESWALVELCLAAVLRCFMMALTFGCKLPAGCFVPALFIGACCGRAVGMWTRALVQLQFPTSEILQTSCGTDPTTCVVPGVYAIVGAAAVLAGVTRMTICLVVIMFELTGGLEYVVPCMLVTVTAKWVAELLGIPSIYEIHLDITKYPYLNTKDEYPFRVTLRALIAEGYELSQRRRRPQPNATVTADDPWRAVEKERGYPTTEGLVVLWNGMPLCDIEALVLRAPRVYHHYPVVHRKDGSQFLGSVTHVELRRELSSTAAASRAPDPQTAIYFMHGEAATHWGNTSPPIRGGGGAAAHASTEALDWSHTLDSCTIQVSLDMVMPKLIHVFKTLGNYQVFIVEGGKLVGVMTRKDMVKFLRHARADGTARGSLMRWISTSR